MTSADQKKRASRLRTRVAKGRQPQFFEDPNTDKLLAMVVALVGEVAVLAERVDTHERLAQAGLVATPDAIEAFEPDEDLEDQRETSRAALLGRVFRVIEVAAQSDPETAEREFRKLLDEAVS